MSTVSAEVKSRKSRKAAQASTPSPALEKTAEAQALPTYDQLLGMFAAVPANIRAPLQDSLSGAYPAIKDFIYRARCQADGKRVLIEEAPTVAVVHYDKPALTHQPSASSPAAAPKSAPAKAAPNAPAVIEVVTSGKVLSELLSLFEELVPPGGVIHLAVKNDRVGLMARGVDQDLAVACHATTGKLGRAWATTPQDLAKALRGWTGELRLRPTPDGGVDIVRGKETVRLSTFAKSYSPLQEPGAVRPETQKLPAGQLVWALAFADLAGGEGEECKAELRDRLFWTGDTIVATDGHRLNWMSVPGGHTMAPRGMPAQALRGLGDFVNRAVPPMTEARIDWWAGAGLARFTIEHGSLLLRVTVVLADNAPKYQGLLPDTTSRLHLTLDAPALCSALEGMVESAESLAEPWYVWCFHAGTLTLTAGPAQQPASYSGQVAYEGLPGPFTTSFDPRYVLEAMTLREQGDTVVFHFDRTDQTTAVLVVEQTGKPEDRYRPATHRAVVMPRSCERSYNLGEKPPKVPSTKGQKGTKGKGKKTKK
jgi:hypothetical protein